jgi:hypothetical protein
MPALGPTQLPIHWMSLSGVKWLGCSIIHPPITPRLKRALLPLFLVCAFMADYRVNFVSLLYFTFFNFFYYLQLILIILFCRCTHTFVCMRAHVCWGVLSLLALPCVCVGLWLLTHKGFVLWLLFCICYWMMHCMRVCSGVGLGCSVVAPVLYFVVAVEN